MSSGSPKWKTVVERPEFRIGWFLCALVVLTIGLAAFFMPLGPALIEAGLMILAVVLVFTSVYHAAESEWRDSLQKSEFKSLVTSLEEALVIYDDGFSILFFNGAAERLFKLNANAAIGHHLSPRDAESDGWRTLAQVIFPSLAPQVVPKSPEGQYPMVADISFADPELELRVSTSPIVDEQGKTLAFMKIIRDRTPQISALRAKEEFITIASHQLRGPVTDISWALQSLVGATELNDTDKMIVENAAAASQGLLRRIEDLLNVSRMEEGHFGYQFEDADINDFIGKTLAEVLPAARKAGVKLYFDRPTEDIPRVIIDPKRLSMVVVNLIENAIRYNVENGEVIVKVEKLADKPFVEVSVKDTGIGIPPEAITKLFTKFFRAENAVKSQTEGSGIGLYIAKGIVRAHGGEIWADSELNRGTTIHFTLPTNPALVPRHEVTADI